MRRRARRNPNILRARGNEENRKARLRSVPLVGTLSATKLGAPKRRARRTGRTRGR